MLKSELILWCCALRAIRINWPPDRQFSPVAVKNSSRHVDFDFLSWPSSSIKTVMGYGSLGFQLVSVFFATLFLLHRYGNWRKQHVFVTVSTFVGWYFSFLIVLLLPLDIAIVSFVESIKAIYEKWDFIYIKVIFRHSIENASWKNRRWICPYLAKNPKVMCQTVLS